MSAAELKAKGNAAFQQKNYEEAIKHFTAAIAIEPDNHVFYSNRSAAYAGLKDFDNALKDGEKTVEINPKWPKGYSRKGAALHFLGRLDDALDVYGEGLKLDPNNQMLMKGVAEVKKAKEAPPQGGPGDIGAMFAQFFQGDIWTKLRMNPNTKPLLDKPEFVQKMTALQQNPAMLSSMLQDKDVLAAVGALTNIGMFSGDDFPGAAGAQAQEPEPTESKPEPVPEPKKPEPKKEPEPEPEPEPKEEDVNETKAAELKTLGNSAYKKKNFDEAISYYDQAIELDPKNIVYHTNKSAALFEAGRLDDCIAECKEAIEVGRKNFADFKLISKPFVRMGNCYTKQKNYKEAIEAFNKALAEDYNGATVTLLRKVEKLKAEEERLAYIDPEKAKEAKERGNALFKKGQYPEALKEYSDAIKRNPEDPVLYSNRAACYTKLADFARGIEDCNTALKLDPKMFKAILRKANLQYSTKQYSEALETYQTAAAIDPENQDVKNGIQRVIMAQRGSGMSDEERYANAVKDPEIQQILSDPVMRQILEQMQNDPKAAQDHLKNPMIMNKIQKLVNAGVLKVQ